MAVICPSCDREPAPDAIAGRPCAACGAPLVRVEEAENLVGKMIDDRFEVVARLGQGGMGTVYRARQRSIGRDVALKLIDRRFETNVTAVKRFFREAKLASQLSHPNTVGVIDFGQSADGRLYLVMEYVRGQTLHAALAASGAMPPPRIARIGLQLCDAIEAAHKLGIIHRDLKLENVMLLERDLVKVLDFGLARSLDDDERATATGMITGTPRYMAPEAVSGAPPAPAQDLYAVGVMLGELALGRALWDAPTFEALLARKLEPIALVGVAKPIAQLVIRLVDANPEARPTVTETRAALEALEVARPPSGPLSEFSIDPAKLVPLDARDDAPPRAPPSKPPPIVLEAPPVIADVVPPPPELKLELEPEWQQERAARASAAPPPVVRSRRAIRGPLAAVALVAIAAVIVFFIVRRQQAPVEHLPGGEGVVVIQLIAPVPTEVTIDGMRAGKTPLRLNLQRSTKKLYVAAIVRETPVSFDIVADRDQVIDLAKPQP